MELRAGYKNTEIGVIPEDWKVEKIDDVLKVSTGSKNTQDKLKDGKYPFFVRSQTIERINSFAYDCEAVLTAGDGVGTGKIFHYVNGKFELHQRVYIMNNFKKNLLGHFFFLYFSNNFYDRVMQMTAKSSVDSVRREMIAEMQIPLPPLPEQTAIANLLSDTDNLLQALQKKIAKKRLIKQGAMQELLKPKEGWVEKSLGEIGKTFGGLSGKSKKDFREGKYPYIPFMNIMTNPIIDKSYFDYVNLSKGESQNKCTKGDLFFNGSSETPEEVGLCSVLLVEIDNLYLNSFCFGFRLFNQSEISGLYLSYFFRSPIGRKHMSLLAQGATRYNLSKANFLKLEINLPKSKEQNKIATILSDMDIEIESLEKQLAKYKQVKQGLMQNLLTGKIRLV